MAKKSEKEILESAKAIAQKYLDCFNTTGKYDLKEIAKALEGRIHEGKPVEIDVVISAEEASRVLKKRLANEPNANELRPYECIWDYYLMAFYDALYSQCPVQDNEFGRQSFYEAFKAGLGYYINLGSYAVAIARPEAYRDPQNRIHKESGPAIVWGKEEQFWWHGTRVEEDWIMNKEKVDVSQALTWPNLEQRRALCEIIGWHNVLKKMKCKHVQKDSFGELLSVNLPDSTEKSLFVRVTCATGREFCLPVAATCKTAREAVAMTYNVPKMAYNPEVRT